MPEQDLPLLTMVTLMNNWGLTGDLAKSTTTTGSGVKFNTRWYDQSIAFPQVYIIPAGSYNPTIMECGSNPTYKHADRIRVGVAVRPKQESNTSLGWAKNAVFSIKNEVDRILESGSTLSSGGINFFLSLGAWRVLDNIGMSRPVVLREEREITVNYFYRRK